MLKNRNSLFLTAKLKKQGLEQVIFRKFVIAINKYNAILNNLFLFLKCNVLFHFEVKYKPVCSVLENILILSRSWVETSYKTSPVSNNCRYVSQGIHRQIQVHPLPMFSPFQQSLECDKNC